ncbi:MULTISPECIES: DUF262 domain-containing protein [Aphanizomenon]|jgi:hypothetical protein|uniref:DUF262 domain-containing protein n=1 Tax=Aphanizomenon flos-aquae FACHB-1040 TaxID=2692887 RepID=A0ABR8BVX5_APHFL|nr:MULTISPECIES: DUF262 domain-containing protein [Aphanizomenon]MBD2278230.1 DUF262 domain-containing protein [Aphanizomenon flos-aquae FACHB-1040]MBO1068495.1 DUF262 domain-containing protein [Dolichospermum sp. DEX189]MTJ28390.1 DUF262 domain-containing protein [Aphanizomenon sp. UHCC 0183]QSV69771.1 MAG: DUF262 domain-containing protein [Aphanizomenon flos-aquae KM1D3_PB]
MENLEEKIALLEQAVSDERKRLSSDRLDISFGELINLYKNDELIIRPEYQRLFRWSETQKTALIESILLSIPIPPIFVAEDKNGVWELVDGLQRVSTFISFFGELKGDGWEINYQEEDVNSSVEEGEEIEEGNGEVTEEEKTLNKWTLQEGGLVNSLQGFNVDTLPTNLKINLKRAVCRVEILRGESSTSMKYELFKRLNSGGSKLTPQEIRNAIYRGINPRLNELLLKISQNEVFKTLTQLTRGKLNELYDQELVLRFFAFYKNAENVNENMEKFLNKFMENTVSNTDFDYNNYESLIIRVLELINQIGDDKIFRNASNLFVPAYFEGILIGVAQNIDKYAEDIELLKSKITQLKSDTDFKRYSGTASNSRSRIRNRLKRADEIFQ